MAVFGYAQMLAAQEGLTAANWLTLVSAVVVALIAAVVAFVQNHRTIAAQRELEREKLLAAERAVDLARERADRAQEQTRTSTYRREQVLPFLEALDATLNSSYMGAYMPPNFPSLGGYIPQLRAHADAALGEWLQRYRDLSQLRLRLFLAIEPTSLQPLIDRLMDLQEQMKRVLETRNKVWYKAASESDLWEAHRAYITTGYGILTSIWLIVQRPVPENETQLSSEEREEMVRRIALPLEKLSTGALPYGTVKDYTWLALWQLDVRPEMLSFVEASHQGSFEDFEAQLLALTQALDLDSDTIETSLVRVLGEAEQITCLTVRLACEADLDSFLSAGLPLCRKRYPLLWSSHRQPIEFRFSPRVDS